MSFQFVHSNRNVANLEKSVAFYKEALDLVETRRKEAEDGSFVLAFLSAQGGGFELELTWLRDWKGDYDLGDNELHLAVSTPDLQAAFAKHKAMDCVCYENTDMGIYFISDPDGYWIEIVPQK
ncbi:MAG: VOC family protein [Oscillospiraceae bacterium]|nr:VOC family protein [Oscillospiraceae bacterium]